jgi:hypothetical protein
VVGRLLWIIRVGSGLSAFGGILLQNSLQVLLRGDSVMLMRIGGGAR